MCGIVNYLLKQAHCFGGCLTAKSLLSQVMGFSPFKDICGMAVKIPIDCHPKKKMAFLLLEYIFFFIFIRFIYKKVSYVSFYIKVIFNGI